MKSIKYILLSCALMLTVSNCTDNFGDINTDPTVSADQNPALQFTRTQLRISHNRYEHWRAQYIYSSCIIQHNASAFSYWSGDKYNEIGSYSSAQWDHDYPNTVKNIVDLVDRTAEDPARANFQAAARILKVFIFHRLTDLYGDVPYSQAGRGFIDNTYFPEYDSQQSIYADLFKELDAGIAGFSDSALPLSGDIWLGNDPARWTKFANSLRLRLASRLVKVDPATAESETRKAISGGVFESTEESAFVMHTDMETNGNSDVMNADDNFRMSNTFVDYLKAQNDPRLPIWGMTYDDAGVAQTDVSTWEGLPNGTDGNSEEFGRYGDFVRHNRSTIKTPSAPMLHLMYSEVQFRLAEAAVRGWGAPMSAADHFAEGLRAAVNQVLLYPNAAIDGAAIDDFVASNPLKEGSTDESLEHINSEIWASTYQNAIEAFSNWRASGYPQLTPVDHEIGTTGGTIPRRLYYPSSEAGLNPNYQTAVDRQFGGSDNLSGRVWWDVQ